MKFLKYVKAIEKNININNLENKIPLGDVLYMMRNARRFGLELTEISDEEDVDLVMRIKTSIHESGYNDVTVKIVGDKQNNNTKVAGTNVYLTNTFKDEKEENEKQNEETESPKPIRDVNIISSRRLEDGLMEITLRDGTTLRKDNYKMHSIVFPNSDSSNQEERKIIERKIEKNKLEEAEINEIQKYVRRFGELDFFEEKHKNDLQFKDRAKKMFDTDLFNKIPFANQRIQFDDKDLYLYFIAELLNCENSFLDGLPHIFIGEVKNKNKNPFPFITIDIFCIYLSNYSKRKSRKFF
ncbi:hypothetical protein JHD48_10280 [Sulfurimonas sp. SAG-AH-194-I05]|nr:hypothetical protein [Sulfurimonas sp. SAG-AH-194-I05]MDF1876119.1 hypothetical protein [Sulfurimonas sp. SAG-AH-194-I05]